MTHTAAARAVLGDSSVSKDPAHWHAWTSGNIPPNWELISWVVARNMFTADGARHDRLREPVKRAFSPRRVGVLRPRITAIVGELLDQAANLAKDGADVDLKAQFALPLPLQVICEMFSVPEPDRPHVQRLCDTAFDQGRPGVDHGAALAELQKVFADLVAVKRRARGDDLASALVNDSHSGFSDAELVDTLVLLVGAGHETTVNLITNAVRGLLTHPTQYTLLRGLQLDDGGKWEEVVEETLRWASPIAALPLRYTTAPVTIADVFDFRRPRAGHLAFGLGRHFCLGAALARLEARIALEQLFRRYNVQLAVAAEDLDPLPSLVACGVEKLPVHLTPLNLSAKKARP